jgi:hypothetical protein
MYIPFYGYFYIQKDKDEFEDISLEKVTKMLLESDF